MTTWLHSIRFPNGEGDAYRALTCEQTGRDRRGRTE